MPDPIVSFDERAIKPDIRELVRQTVEDTINALLDEEADLLVNAERYERTADRGAYRAGHYTRSFTTTSGNIEVATPKLKGARFVAAAIERYKRRGAGAEMCPTGAPARRVEDVSEILWGASVSAGTVSNLDGKASGSIGERRNRPLNREYRYVYVDGIYLKRAWGGAVGNAAVMVAVGAAEGFAGSTVCRRGFLGWPKSRGLRGVGMFAGDKAAGMVGALAEAFPDAAYQRCTARFYRNALSKVPGSKKKAVAARLKATHAQESFEACEEKALRAAADLEGVKLEEAAKVVREGCLETLACARLPEEHRRRIRTDNAIERLNREIGGRTKVVGSFPDGKSALMLVAARLKYVADSEWGSRRYLDVSLPDERSCRLSKAVAKKRARLLTVPCKEGFLYIPEFAHNSVNRLASDAFSLGNDHLFSNSRFSNPFFLNASSAETRL